MNRGVDRPQSQLALGMAASRRKKKKATNASLWYSQPLIEELPSFSFGGKGVARQETVVGPHAVPGPGEYDISYNYGEESHTRREHFGISERPPLSTAVYGPGPGTYDHGIRCHAITRGGSIPLPGDALTHFFLSHCQATGGDQTNAIYLELRQMGFSCW